MITKRRPTWKSKFGWSFVALLGVNLLISLYLGESLTAGVVAKAILVSAATAAFLTWVVFPKGPKMLALKRGRDRHKPSSDG